MFDTSSRYYRLETATYVTSDERSIRYVRRRFLRQGGSLPLLVEVTLAEGDRLDLITAHTLGDPEQFWRVADANDAMNPFELTGEPGETLRIPVPQVEA